MPEFTYILSLSDNTFYIGYTTNLKRRLKEHNEGIGAKRTRGRTATLIHYECSKDKSKALKLENTWKKLTRKEKEEMIKNNHLTIII